MKSVATLFLFLISFYIHGQVLNPKLLKQTTITFSERYLKNKKETLDLARKLKMPMVLNDSVGTSFELADFVNSFPRYLITHNSGGASLIKTSDLYTGGGAGYNLSGAGSLLGIWDAGRVRLEHQELTSRVSQLDNASTNHNHATHVAGTMIATGQNNSAKGMSFGAQLWAHDWNNDTGEMANAALNGLEISQHSYGYLTGWHYGSWSGTAAWHWFGDPAVSITEDYYFGHYGETAQEWDDLAFNAPEYLISVSAGNDRGQGPAPASSHYFWDGTDWQQSTVTRERDGGSDGYDCISHRGLGKNVITIGAVDGAGVMTSFSSWGPTDDGRIKPDVVAKGTNVLSTGANANDHYYSSGGTSMSGPMVSGSVGIIMEHQEDLHAGQKLTAAMKKALIIHTANDLIDGVAGPDYRFGWGLMNTRKAVETMTRNATSRQGVLMMESSLFPGDTVNLQIHATGMEALRATVVWTDRPGIAQTAVLNANTPSLINDLDMRLFNAGNTSFSPYILNPAIPTAAPTSGDNFRDNVEMIHLSSTNTGDVYNLKIHHKGSLLSDQKFALVISGANINDCPVLAKAPGKATIQNSFFDTNCNLAGGQILPPTSSLCPAGSIIQYKVNNGNWSSSLPSYSQNGPEQHIYTRCVCTSSPDYTSPESKVIITKPNSIQVSSDGGMGSLRMAITCSVEFDTIHFDHVVTDSVMIINTLDVNKCLTLQGGSSAEKSKIVFDFNSLGSNPGLMISNLGKELILSNMILESINNNSNNPLIQIQTGNNLIIDNEVFIDY